MISLENLSKSFGDNKVFEKINLIIKKGEITILLGPSGCGKTTLLKTINGLVEADSGNIHIEGKERGEWDLIDLRRSIGYVIQQTGLFPHMTIENNITYVPDLRKMDKKKSRRRGAELLQLTGLPLELLTRYPHQLSGGQRQRVGVARALAADPRIILMDEPFSAVDEIGRTALQEELKTLQKKLGLTILLVTHDIDEAVKLGDTIVLMNKGKIEQEGDAESIIFNPASDFVRGFFRIKGLKSLLDEETVEKLYERKNASIF